MWEWIDKHLDVDVRIEPWPESLSVQISMRKDINGTTYNMTKSISNDEMRYWAKNINGDRQFIVWLDIFYQQFVKSYEEELAASSRVREVIGCGDGSMNTKM